MGDLTSVQQDCFCLQAQLREPNASVVGQAPINTKGDIVADVQFDVVYLGEAAAVLRVVPADDEDDEEAASQPLFVLQKSGTQSLPILVRAAMTLHGHSEPGATLRVVTEGGVTPGWQRTSAGLVRLPCEMWHAPSTQSPLFKRAEAVHRRMYAHNKQSARAGHCLQCPCMRPCTAT